MSSVVGSVRVLRAPTVRDLDGRPVVVMALYRGPRRMTNDLEVGTLRTEDVLEVAPIVAHAAGRVRVAWFTFGVTPDMLGPSVGSFEGCVPDGVVRKA